MISLKENYVGLINLKGTIDAIQSLDELIEYYSVDKPGPAYVTFNHIGSGPIDVQFDRQVMLATLKVQRQKLVDCFAKLGITVDI